MKNIIFLSTILFLSCFTTVFAEKIPVKILPLQVVSTHHNETEIGDWINFEIVEDVYFNDNLYLKKGTKVIGIVDYVHNNGWLGDAAEITFKRFVTADVNHKRVEIDYPVLINGNIILKDQPKQYTITVLNNIASLVNFIPIFALVRGSEIQLEPDTKTFNILIERL